MFVSTRRLFRLHSGLGKIVRYNSDEAKAKVEPQPVVKFMGSARIIFGMVITAIGGVAFLLNFVDGMMTKYKSSFENLEKAMAIAPEVVKSASELVFEKAPSALEKSHIDKATLAKTFVARPGVREKIREALVTKEPVNYYVVYGPRGVGKSEIVAQTAAEKENKYVVWHKVASASSREELIKGLLFELTGQEANVTAGALQKIIVEFQASHNGEVPTIIFDVERHSNTLQTVRGLAKDLVNFCRFFIVLSEASAVVDLQGDIARETFVYVYEMTIPEATKYLEKLGAKFNDEELTYIFNTIGTSPGMLKDLHYKVCINNVPLDEHVKNILAAMVRDFDNFPVKPILKALQEHPDGIPTSYFFGRKYDGVELSSPDAVFRALKNVSDGKGEKKQTNVLVYRTDLGMYQLASTAHKTALKNYKVPSFSWWSFW
jgi:hypothetical protein